MPTERTSTDIPRVSGRIRQLKPAKRFLDCWNRSAWEEMSDFVDPSFRWRSTGERASDSLAAYSGSWRIDIVAARLTSLSERSWPVLPDTDKDATIAPPASTTGLATQELSGADSFSS